ncbi:General transcriptional corepressor tupA [Porphyridium purpureum]|uniref:General transcriptional corepressor tupA n=1 Tax=Porphyridium purpureum TaxID=35688 RepID=A0A5J4YLH8_PORPP|nr:General transcriptional corepressor tupA [Porphyridium purpureum]|eukprot:POR8061..scf244_11
MRQGRREGGVGRGRRRGVAEGWMSRQLGARAGNEVDGKMHAGEGQEVAAFGQTSPMADINVILLKWRGLMETMYGELEALSKDVQAQGPRRDDNVRSIETQYTNLTVLERVLAELVQNHQQMKQIYIREINVLKRMLMLNRGPLPGIPLAFQQKVRQKQQVLAEQLRQQPLRSYAPASMLPGGMPQLPISDASAAGGNAAMLQGGMPGAGPSDGVGISGTRGNLNDSIRGGPGFLGPSAFGPNAASQLRPLGAAGGMEGPHGFQMGANENQMQQPGMKMPLQGVAGTSGLLSSQQPQQQAPPQQSQQQQQPQQHQQQAQSQPHSRGTYEDSFDGSRFGDYKRPRYSKLSPDVNMYTTTTVTPGLAGGAGGAGGVGQQQGMNNFRAGAETEPGLGGQVNTKGSGAGGSGGRGAMVEEQTIAGTGGQGRSGGRKSMDPQEIDAQQQQLRNDYSVVYENGVNSSMISADAQFKLRHNNVICCVRYSWDGAYIATGSNWNAHLFDAAEGKLVCTFSERGDANTNSNINAGDVGGSAGANKPDAYVRTICFTPDTRHLVSGGKDGMINVWNLATQQRKMQLVGHESDIFSVDCSSDGRMIASGSGDKLVKLWDANNGKLLRTLGGNMDGSAAGVTGVVISPDGSKIAVGSMDMSVRLWDVESGRLIRQMQAHKDCVYSVAFSPDGKYLLSGSLDQTLNLWDMSGAGIAPPMTLSGHRDYVLSVGFSNNGRWIVSGSKDMTVQFWDIRSARACMALQGHNNSVISISHSPTTNHLATGGGDFITRTWRINYGM